MLHAGWALVRTTVREFVHGMRHPTPLPVRYLRCDGCDNVTPHTRYRRLYAIQMPERELTAPPPEVICDECEYAQPRTVGDEISADTTVHGSPERTVPRVSTGTRVSAHR
jgi:hypothetical protein